LNGINIFEGLGQTFLTVFISLLPLVVLFLIFQFFYLRLPAKRVLNLFKGIALALLGVAIFLQGVRVGFFPVGREMGEILGAVSHKWVLMPLGFLLGFLATLGEPAVRVLSDQIERTSIGSIRKSVVLYTICVGVALFVALGMARIIYGIPLMYIVVPGYILAMVLLWPTDKTTICVAFDAGGVATGPMAVTFLLAITVGIASAMEGRDPVTDGFGLIALIALAPILSIMILGIIVRIKLHKKEG
jgi:hypothetical protein